MHASLPSLVSCLCRKPHSTNRILQSCRNLSSQNTEPGFGLMFDIDGVLVRGRQVLPAAQEAFKKLVDSNGKFRVPTIFVTNAGNSLRCQKAAQLSDWLGVPIDEDQVVLAHSPFKLYKQFHHKRVLVSGQGPLMEIAKQIGFTNACTVDDTARAFPALDVVDQQKRKIMKNTIDYTFPPIEALVLLGEPVRWETSLQILMDTLMTNGQLINHPSDELPPYPHLPVLACNLDLQWMAEAWLPRFGHGAFLVCLEELYKKVSGRDLIYTALVGKPSEVTFTYAENVILGQAKALGIRRPISQLYFVGDNLNTDILGANLYNSLLQRRSRSIAMAMSGNEIEFDCDVDVPGEAEECCSILVQTGVYRSGNGNSNAFNHLPRNYLHVSDSQREPKFIAEDVSKAVELVFEREKFPYS